MTTVAFQGELGAFSEEAVHRFFGEGVSPVPRRGFAEVGQAVASREVDFGLLPIENSLAGSVVGSYDVLSAGDLEVVGEVVTPIHHCLLGVPGTRLDEIAHVLSHPVALAQCQRFLQAHPAMEAVVFYDTAGAAREVATERQREKAAIAGRGAAERYGLDVLASDIEDRHDNQTRFLVVARPGERPSAAQAHGVGPMKSALLVETRNTPGALVRLLVPFADRGINLSKIESRPGTEPWSYRFFIEVEADANSPEAREALRDAAPHAARLQLLGTFARAG
ncbi:MAG TPA: prephenate dehydratase [Longimicrobiaceae bacterium]